MIISRFDTCIRAYEAISPKSSKKSKISEIAPRSKIRIRPREYYQSIDLGELYNFCLHRTKIYTKSQTLKSFFGFLSSVYKTPMMVLCTCTRLIGVQSVKPATFYFRSNFDQKSKNLFSTSAFVGLVLNSNVILIL